MTLVELLQSSPALFAGLVFLLGLLVGSFLNVVIHRLPVMMEREWLAEHALYESKSAASAPAAQAAPPPRYNLIVPRSACPACQAPIHAWQNIPLVSYALLRGKCAACGTHISLRYPIVELLTGVLSAAVAWKFGFGWEAAAALVFTWCLIALAGIDIDHQLLPDSITLPLVWLGLLVSLGYWGPTDASFPVDPRTSIIGAVVGYLSLWTVYHLYKLLTHKEGMGYGDFKLFAAFGAWFGWTMLLPVILMAALTGAAVGVGLIVARRLGRDVPISFGPFLAAAGWIVMMWGPQLVTAYFGAWGR